MLGVPKLAQGSKGKPFIFGWKQAVELLICLWTCDLAGPRQLLEVASYKRALPDEDFLNTLAKERSNLQVFFPDTYVGD